MLGMMQMLRHCRLGFEIQRIIDYMEAVCRRPARAMRAMLCQD